MDSNHISEFIGNINKISRFFGKIEAIHHRDTEDTEKLLFIIGFNGFKSDSPQRHRERQDY